MFDSGEATGASADGASNADSPGSAGQVKTWTYPEAREFIIQTFHGFSDDLGNFAAQAFDKRWIDAQPRTGKVGGAYCTDLPKPGESRILANFDGSFSSVSTLAHELGHAYHSYVLRDQPQLLRGYPMTLAETASIFCETIIYNTAIGNSQGFERLSLVEGILSESTQVIVDILSRFYFEKALFAARQESELSADQLCAAMLDAQKATYGDGLNQDELHPYMWAVKGHYYSPELAFYNFPYAFGQLFGLGLYAQYQNDPQGFPGVYRELLIETGRANAVDVCKTAGFDIESTDFWNQGLSAIVTHVNTFTKGSK
jgi:oligoendopeptidase F